jgi:omega-6 fatty acid desaturase (delta-12 desaturase)
MGTAKNHSEFALHTSTSAMQPILYQHPSPMIKKSDFVLTPFMKSSNLRAIYQILNTLIPYILLWILAMNLAPTYPWLFPPIVALLVLFSLRCFSLMHDCGHNSLFRSKFLNRLFGFLLGVINAIPQYGWSRDHAFHHKTNGDWERYRGVADFLSTREFAQLSPAQQKLYETLRHPLMGIPGGFFYLAIKPRLALIMGIYDLLAEIGRKFKGGQAISAHQSKQWQSLAEFGDLLLNNICVISGWIGLSYLWGGLFWTVYAITLSLSATIFIWVFFVQHIFEGAYAHRTAGWDYVEGAIKGSSYLELPAILRWFSADIGYHNIHHLSERIPNYRLADCHRANSHLLSEVKTLHITDLFDCAQFLLWDEDLDQLVTIADFRARVNQSSAPLVESV